MQCLREDLSDPSPTRTPNLPSRHVRLPSAQEIRPRRRSFFHLAAAIPAPRRARRPSSSSSSSARLLGLLSAPPDSARKSTTTRSLSPQPSGLRHRRRRPRRPR